MPCPFYFRQTLMSSTFRFKDFSAHFNASPDDVYYIEYGNMRIPMPNARAAKKFIEEMSTVSWDIVYKVLKSELEDRGYYVSSSEPTQCIWLGESKPVSRKNVLDSSFWGRILLSEVHINGN